MTILVYDAHTNLVHCDSLSSWDDGMRQSAPKIEHPVEGITGAYAGGVGGSLVLALAAAALARNPATQFITLEEDVARLCDDVEAFIKVHSVGVVFYVLVRRTTLLITVAGPVTYATGSGASAFRAKVMQHLENELFTKDRTPEALSPHILQMMQSVCEQVPSCGLPILTF